MTEPTPTALNVIAEAVLYVAFSIVSGFLGYAMRSMDDKDRPFRMVRGTIEAASAGLVGLLVFMMCKAMGLDNWWTGVVVGLLSWMGATASIRVIEAVIYKRLGLTKD